MTGGMPKKPSGTPAASTASAAGASHKSRTPKRTKATPPKKATSDKKRNSNASAAGSQSASGISASPDRLTEFPSPEFGAKSENGGKGKVDSGSKTTAAKAPAGSGASSAAKTGQKPSKPEPSRRRSGAQESLQHVLDTDSNRRASRDSITFPVPGDSDPSEERPHRPRMRTLKHVHATESAWQEVNMSNVDSFKDKRVKTLLEQMKNNPLFDRYKLVYARSVGFGWRYEARVIPADGLGNLNHLTGVKRTSEVDRALAVGYGDTPSQAILECEDGIESHIQENRGIWQTVRGLFTSN